MVIIVVTVLLLLFIYRRQLHTTAEARARITDLDPGSEIVNRRLLIKSLLVLFLTITGFFLHQTLGIETATVALFGAFLLLLLTGENYLERALSKVEWTTIFFFVGLFVLVSGLVETGVITRFAQSVIDLTGGQLLPASFLILWMSAFASAFIDNIPFVATMIPVIQDMGNMGVRNLEPLWWSLALGACLGGNGMLIGASANLIVAGLSGKEGYPITFMKYMKIGLPVMILSIAISSAYIYLRYLL